MDEDELLDEEEGAPVKWRWEILAGSALHLAQNILGSFAEEAGILASYVYSDLNYRVSREEFLVEASIEIEQIVEGEGG